VKTPQAAVIATPFSLPLNSYAFTSVGIGNSSCGEYMNRNVAQAQVYDGWVAGYLTSLNMMTNGSIGKGVDGPSMLLWIEKWCRENPMKTFRDRMLELSLWMKAHPK
jgi:hypothetical protein